ncbi:polymer-forming cytoskeletal protein [Butyrivibrio sp. CB08]|uniref:polymer-forming cytoskeletal protein n=1 Tax=Butyrivibrio sp. CB08 TaxID=2364879 RepID=UPI000EA9FF36|nr:polymer-forming cytoskeletal protein [Butyrivibrio sp. CB08]RKM62060.1 polymer-forming cytoskeletal protein [Butyrivibrio sp. CB08]
MGFFSELKSDLSQAVNTLMPEDKPEAEGLDNKATETKEPVDIDSMLNRLDDIKLEDAAAKTEEKVEEKLDETASKEEDSVVTPEEPVLEEIREVAKEAEEDALEEKIEEQTMEELEVEEPKNALEAINPAHIDKYVADKNAETEMITKKNGGIDTMDFENQTPTDEVASITEGMIVKGDIATTGSLELVGKITGNIKCLGKLNVTGEITGDSDAAEIYAESARITGEVRSKGSVKVGQSTVIVGNIFGSSAVIAGAVKGDIDVHGPVVLDTTAIVMGNIKSQSVQINNGAVIEGMCSQAYADVNPSEFFEGLKNK